MESTPPQLALGVARGAAERYGEVLTIHRFPTGLCHYVFDVSLSDGDRLVVRVADAVNRHLLQGAIGWSERLRPLGVPLPALLGYDLDESTPMPYLVLERLPGEDLGLVYRSLTPVQRAQLAAAVSRVQLMVQGLQHAGGYGYSHDPTQPAPSSSWAEVVADNLRRSRGRLRASSSHLSELHAGVVQLVESRESYFSTVHPVPFLDDLTTKNVIVDAGRLTGIVDVDLVCFGDPLFTPALTKVALVASGVELDYVEAWLQQETLTAPALNAFEVYCGVFCMDLLSEAGMIFNKDEPTVMESAGIARLIDLAAQVLARRGE